MQGITQWMAGWKRNGWRTAAKKPVANRELWEKLDSLLNVHDVTWDWVKGHSGIRRMKCATGWPASKLLYLKTDRSFDQLK